jgi:streptogramin lyase
MRISLLPVAVFALAAVAPSQFIITANTGQSRLTAFSPVDGSVAIANVFPLVNTAQVAAIDVNGEIWISEQVGDRITRRDLAGNILGVIGPTFPGGGLDNIRGMAFIGGIVYVTNAGTANGAPGANAIVCFDAAGNHLFNFLTTGTAPSPFGVLSFQGDLLISSSSGNNDVHRFSTTGTPVGPFHNSTGLNFAHQLSMASDGNVWCAGFSTNNVVKLDATTGAILFSFPASGARGVYELMNGNILWTNSSGAHIYDIVAAASTTVVTGSCYHLNPYFAASASAATYGVGCDGLALSSVGIPVLGNLAFALNILNVPLVSPLGLVAVGTLPVDPGIDLTALGMPGCFSHTTFDIGLFSAGPNLSGTSTFPLPIPNLLPLSGATLALQGVSFSLSTPLGLASSNGVAIVVGK